MEFYPFLINAIHLQPRVFKYLLSLCSKDNTLPAEIKTVQSITTLFFLLLWKQRDMNKIYSKNEE